MTEEERQRRKEEKIKLEDEVYSNIGELKKMLYKDEKALNTKKGKALLARAKEINNKLNYTDLQFEIALLQDPTIDETDEDDMDIE